MSRSPQKRPDRQMSILQVFRAAARAGDARDAAPSERRADDDRIISVRRRQSRDGSDPVSMQSDLAIDIASLMNTIRLDALVDLSDAPLVQKSIINYGFRDMSSLTRSQETTARIAASIRESLVRHEPRLIAETLEVRVSERSAKTDQRIFFDITAEMRASPADLPMDFVAEVDLGAGKLRMTGGRPER
ncbi:type VI secretion system baseplate subunit TssE [Paracoccus zhejiangensis]|uniref:Type VI secretion system baseplate subunit TssE n=1 Tax=Paracoccus zhejiangensis TaxID=1077935 RepID=A0A2H5F037_9RHOB|nr:type VI secretion system baseplate subunit TssE [Paracoccus zhejiangensis]AUH64911.1 type VI secretion system baseplate subunit TssE [Paracoccus zhejiangensis]